MILKMMLPVAPEPYVEPHPREDALSINAAGTIFAVADGVTRTSKEGRYPSPSPAQFAADTFCTVALQVLQDDVSCTEKSVHTAFAKANRAIGKVNDELGLSQKVDYFIDDLAGTVGALAIKDGLHVVGGYIGDCGIAILDRQGNIRWQTVDDVAVARQYFPSKAGLSAKEHQVRIRRDHRNKPGAPYPTYGVLTGEAEAMAYARTVNLMLKPHETLVIFSDGAFPILADPQARYLLTRASQADLEHYIRQAREHNDMTSELSIVAVSA